MSHMERSILRNQRGIMNERPRMDMANSQSEWKDKFVNLVAAARRYARSGLHRCAQGYQEFVYLSSAAIALYQLEERHSLYSLMEVWPRDGWEKKLHEAAVAWGELSACVPRAGGRGDYATLSLQRMRALQQTALACPLAETVHDLDVNDLDDSRDD
jgi:hypothetical protein